jgi:hypothetical protein
MVEPVRDEASLLPQAPLLSTESREEYDRILEAFQTKPIFPRMTNEL